MGIWFGLATALSWSIGIFPFTEATRAFGSNTVNTTRLLLASLALAVITMLGTGIGFEKLFTLPGGSAWLWLGLSGLVGLALGDYYSFNAFARLGPRNSSVFTTLAPGAALLMAFLVKGSLPGYMELLGMAVTLFGVFLLLNLQRRKSGSEPMNKRGIFDAVMAALCQGAGLVLSEIGMERVDTLSPVHAAWIRMFAGTAVLYLLALAGGKIGTIHRSVLQGERKSQLMLLAGTLFGPVLGITLAMQTVKHLDAPIAQTIFSLVPILAIPLARIIYKERITAEMVWPALIAFAGVVILVSQ
jgi:drug/metabolite transporter (DMT)-like permease